MKKALLPLFFLFFTVGIFAQASLSVQGVLTKSDGTAVDDGEYDITFRLWKGETTTAGADKVHEETISGVETTGGVYSVVLGQQAGHAIIAPFNQIYYLGVGIGSGAELSPRPLLTHAPYALSLLGQNNQFPSTGLVVADAIRIKGGSPNAGVNGYAFAAPGDVNGGMYSSAGGHVALFSAGTEKIKMSGTLNELFGQTNTNNLKVFGLLEMTNTIQAKAGAPGAGVAGQGYSFASGGDQDGGVFSLGDNNVGLYANATKALEASNSGVYIPGNLNVDGVIGTNNPKVTINKPVDITDVNGVNYPMTQGQTVAYLTLSGVTSGAYGGSVLPASLNVSGTIKSGNFVAVSDRRIKKDFSPIDKAESLAKLQKLQVTDYRYIDEITKGSGLKKGFIAQEVEAIEPGAINFSTSFIPNIYAPAEKIESAGQQLIFKMAKPHGLQKGEKVRVFIGSEQHDATVETARETSFSVEKWGAAVPTGAFVFGKEVNDFRAVDYDHIFAMNVAATQELARRTEVLETENAALRAKLDSQSAAIGELAKRMNLIENAGATGMRK